MHEMAIIAHVIDTLDRYAERNRIREIQTVVLQVGALSGVIPEFVHECWEPAVYFSTHLKHSDVKIEEIPAIGMCRDCKTEYDMQATQGVCPNCGSHRWYQRSGSEMNIKEVLVAETEFIREPQPEAASGKDTGTGSAG